MKTETETLTYAKIKLATGNQESEMQQLVLGLANQYTAEIAKNFRSLVGKEFVAGKVKIVTEKDEDATMGVARIEADVGSKTWQILHACGLTKPKLELIQ